jgi:hypothetical protein
VVAAALVVGCGLASAAIAAAQRIAADEGRISVALGDDAMEPQSYVLRPGRGSVCEMSSWEQTDSYGQVVYCRTIGDRYWRRSIATIDLLFEEFVFLAGFVTAGPRPERAVATSIGTLQIYGFDVDATPEGGSQCVGFVKGFRGSGVGVRELLLAYACVDEGPFGADRTDALMRGLSVADSFESLLP